MKKERFTRIAVSSILALAVVAAGVTMYRSQVNKKNQEIQEQEMLPEGESPQEDTAKHTEEDAKVQENASGNQENSDAEDSSAQAVPEESAGENAADVSGNGVVQETPETGVALEDAAAGTENASGEIQEEVQDTSADQVETAPQLNFSDGTVISWPVNGTPIIDYSMDATVYFHTLDVYKCRGRCGGWYSGNNGFGKWLPGYVRTVEGCDSGGGSDAGRGRTAGSCILAYEVLYRRGK